MKMDIEICKQCEYFPDKYYIINRDKIEVKFHGFRKNSNNRDECSCILTYEGSKFRENNVSYNPYFLLKNPRIKPMEYICPYYMEHQLSEWNKADES